MMLTERLKTLEKEASNENIEIETMDSPGDSFSVIGIIGLRRINWRFACRSTIGSGDCAGK